MIKRNVAISVRTKSLLLIKSLLASQVGLYREQSPPANLAGFVFLVIVTFFSANYYSARAVTEEVES